MPIFTQVQSSTCAKIDMIGIQMHLMRKHRNAELVAQGKPIWNPEKAYYVLDKLAEHNLPMCMSEITITSPGSDYRGEMIQSIVAVNLYRLWFSYPNMTAITYNIGYIYSRYEAKDCISRIE